MVVLKNYFSKIYHNDIGESFSILVYLDYDEILSEKYILSYMNEVLEKNDILKQTIIEENENLLLNTINKVDINKYYTINYNTRDNFNKYIAKLINEKFNTELKWKFVWCIDKDSKKTRLYFKIHHAYTDGYNLIKILTSPFNNTNIINKLKRKTNFLDTIYYYFIGTITLLILNLKIIYNLLSNPCLKKINKKSSDYLICKKLNFNKIKEYTKKHNITINDFLYFLMIKTDKLYRKKEKELNTISLIHVSGINQTNNVCPIINTINNTQDDKSIIKKIHDTFNKLKYSLFVPFLNYFLYVLAEYIYLDGLSALYNNILNNSDYIFSNVIGPDIKEITDVKMTDIHFLTAAKNSEIMYNIISCNENINIICTFKEGVIKNKKKFKRCLYKTYLDILNK
jgi:hypothetical protein